MREQVINEIASRKIIAIVRGLAPELLKPLAQALLEGGISLIEVTFAQDKPGSFRETAASIKLLNTEFDGRITAGAGTVLTRAQLLMAYNAGAKYIVTPSTDPNIIREARALGMVTLPGALTPTEIVTAYNAGADFVKIFPAGNMGAAYIKAVRAPLKHIPMLAVGGVNEENCASFIEAGCCGIGVGGNLVNKKWVEGGELYKITELAAKYVTLLNK